MKRVFTNAVKRLLARAFAVGQRLGVDILPRHFYSEIPDLRQTAANSPGPGLIPARFIWKWANVPGYDE